MDLGTTMRVIGTAEFIDDAAIKERLLTERLFLRPFVETVVIFCVRQAKHGFGRLQIWDVKRRLRGFAISLEPLDWLAIV